MKTLINIIFLFFSISMLSQESKAYLLLDKKDELIICEDFFCRIFLNKEKLEQYYYYQKNKFPVKDSTGVLDMSITEDDIHPYLLVSKYREESYCINEKTYENLPVLNRLEFIQKYKNQKEKYKFYFIERIKEDLYEITPMHIDNVKM